MLGVIRSWGDSLKLLAPSSLKVWGLLTLKGSLESYKILLKYFWWLLLAILTCLYFIVYFKVELQNYIISSESVRLGPNELISIINELPKFQSQMDSYNARANVAQWLSIILIMIWCVCCFLAVRPSIAKKNIKYFVGYWAHGLVSLFLAVLMFTLLVLMMTSSLHLYEWYVGRVPNTRMNVFSGYKAHFLIVFFVLVLLFTLFFLLDSQLSLRSIFKSLRNGIKLVWYHLPICIILWSVLYLLRFGVSFLDWGTAGTYGFNTIGLIEYYLLFPVYIHILLYMYIKQIYGHPERYQ